MTAIENDVEQALVVLERGGETLRVPADAVLVAVGRRPNLEGLNVEASGVDLTDHGGVITDDHLRSTVPNVWALGDVRGKHQFTYIAYDDYRIVASDLLGDGTRTTSSRGAIPYAVFTTPPFARVGMTEDEARDAGFNVKTALLPVDHIIRARILDEPTGVLKAVVDANSSQILGMHLFCTMRPNGEPGQDRHGRAPPVHHAARRHLHPSHHGRIAEQPVRRDIGPESHVPFASILC